MEENKYEVESLEVEVGTNINFQELPLHCIIVHLSYANTDFTTQTLRANKEAYIFTENETKKTFRCTLARDEKGQLLNQYQVKIEVQSKPDSTLTFNLVEFETNEKTLELSLEKIGLFPITLKASEEVDWEIVRQIQVELDGFEESKTITLTKANLDYQLITQIPYGKSFAYKYKVECVHQDGSKSTKDWESTSATSLLIEDDLEAEIVNYFVLHFDKTLMDNVTIETKYEDKEKGVNTIVTEKKKRMGTWYSKIKTRKESPQTRFIRYTAMYKDGTIQKSKWQKIQHKENFSIKPKRIEQAIEVDGTQLDWTKWKRVYGELIYEDKTNGVTESERIIINKNQPVQIYSVMAFDEVVSHFQYNLTFVGIDGKETITGKTEDNSLILSTKI